MIKMRVGVPHIPFIEVAILFERLQLPIVHLNTALYKASGIKVWSPDSGESKETGITFVYAGSMTDLEMAEPKMAVSKRTYVVLVGGDPVTLQEYSIPAYPKAHLDPADVMFMGDASMPQVMELTPLTRHVDAAAQVYASKSHASILQAVLTLFYRVADKSERAVCQETTFRYLTGASAKPPITGVKKLDQILASQAAADLRTATIEGAHRTHEEQEDLNYDVRYLLAKAGKLKAKPT